MKDAGKKHDSGFTLLEVMVSMMILSLIAAGMTPVFISHLKTNTRSQIKTGAIAAAQQVLDDLRSQNPQTMPSSGSSSAQSIIVDDRTYSAVTSYCLVSAFCSTINTRHIKVEISHLGKDVYSIETVFTKLK